MIIYEVNLDVDQEIQKEFESWLVPHIQEIIRLPGFTGAQWLNRDPSEGEQTLKKHYWTVQYFLKDRESYENYLKNHARAMREDGLRRFGGKFEASRRLLESIQVFD